MSLGRQLISDGLTSQSNLTRLGKLAASEIFLKAHEVVQRRRINPLRLCTLVGVLGRLLNTDSSLAARQPGYLRFPRRELRITKASCFESRILARS